MAPRHQLIYTYTHTTYKGHIYQILKKLAKSHHNIEI